MGASHGKRAALVLALVLLGPAPAHASFGGGLGKIVSGVLAIPVNVLSGTFGGPPVIGTLNGAISGVLNTVAGVGGGTLELMGSALPALKSLAPLIPIFI